MADKDWLIEQLRRGEFAVVVPAFGETVESRRAKEEIMRLIQQPAPPGTPVAADEVVEAAKKLIPVSCYVSDGKLHDQLQCFGCRHKAANCNIKAFVAALQRLKGEATHAD